MISITDKTKCSGCYACVNICPKDCILMSTDQEGFWYPKVDADKCVNCGLCEKVCPILSPLPEKAEENPPAYAVVNQDAEVREQSSSGGVFTLLAEEILAQGGAVFGVALSKDVKKAEHICVTKETDLGALRGSKYFQSQVGDTYRQAKKWLGEGKPVLFTGTPCQIAGLKAYLGKEEPLLYTQDIICHGVPSPAVWTEYLRDREKKENAKVCGASFRHKKYGWKRFSMRLEFENGNEVVEDLKTDLFMRGFLSDICLRPSCYACAFKGEGCVADITLADFWGIENVLPEMDDDRGISLVLIRTEKGKALFEKVKGRCNVQGVPFAEAVQQNPAVRRPAILPKKRKIFMEEFEKKPIDKLLDRHSKRPLSDVVVGKAKWFVKGVLRKLGLR